jgi:hypothetical protein
MEQRILNMEKPTQQSHTFASRTSRHTSQSLQKSVPVPPEKKFNFFLPSLRCFNFFATRSRHDKTAKPTSDKDFNASTDRTPAGNSGFAKKRVQWLIEHSASHQILWYVDSLVLRNPLLRKAANRYV